MSCHNRLMIAPKLLVIRGNSGSGKSSLAREIRARYGRGCALVEQDYLRRIVLRAHEASGDPPSAAPALIASVCTFALANGYHVILEGILAADRYATMLHDLIAGHAGPSYVYYMDISYEETIRRHAMRPQRDAFTAEDMRGWYRDSDPLGVPGEHIIGEASTFEQSVEFILATSQLLDDSPLISAKLTDGTVTSG